jgi:hypothetical protein
MTLGLLYTGKKAGERGKITQKQLLVCNRNHYHPSRICVRRMHYGMAFRHRLLCITQRLRSGMAESNEKELSQQGTALKRVGCCCQEKWLVRDEAHRIVGESHRPTEGGGILAPSYELFCPHVSRGHRPDRSGRCLLPGDLVQLEVRASGSVV